MGAGNRNGGRRRTTKGRMTIMGKDGKPTIARAVASGSAPGLRPRSARMCSTPGSPGSSSKRSSTTWPICRVPTRFLCSWIQSNYAEKILEAFKAETAGDRPAAFHRARQRPGPSAARRRRRAGRVEPEAERDARAATPACATIRAAAPQRRCALGLGARSQDDLRQLRRRRGQRDGAAASPSRSPAPPPTTP